MPASTPAFDLGRLYAEEISSVYAFLHRLGARGGDLEDLAHDTFATAMKRASTYDPARPAKPWLLGIGFRVWSDSRRKAEVVRTSLDADAVEAAVDERAGGVERVEQRERQALIQEALGSLDETRRAVFVMHELEGLAPAEIAELTGTPVATTYSRLRVGREEFTAAVRRIQLRRGER